MSIITDEMVEKAWNTFDIHCSDPESPAPSKHVVQFALESVANDIIEACAKVADDFCGWDCRCTPDEIRALKSP